MALAILILLGAALRVWTAAALSPVAASLSDTIAYVGMADGSLFSDPIRQSGYSIFLRAVHLLSAQVELAVAVQHLLGILTGALIYAAVRRASGPVWAAAIAAAAVLLSLDQVFLEQALMSEATFTFVLALAVYAAVRALEPSSARVGPLPARAAWLLAAGATAGLLPWLRLAGLPLLAVIAIWVFAALPELGLRRRLANAAAFAAPALAVVLGYAVLSAAGAGGLGLTPSSGWGVYARAAQFADCARFAEPAGTESLCERTPAEQRNGPDFYLFEPGSPARRLYGSIPNGNEQLGAFGRAAILAQPLDYVEAAARDFARFFIRPTLGRRPFAGPAYEALEIDRRAPEVEADVLAAINGYYDAEPLSVGGSAAALGSLQHVLRFHPTLMLVSVALGLAGLILCAGVRRRAIALLLAVALALLATPVLTTTYSARYAIPVGGLLAAAGGLGLAGALDAVRARRERA